MSETLINSPVKHWCEFEFISKTVKNPNIHIKGNYSYYSAYWDQGFERCVVRYLHDKPATADKPIDQLLYWQFCLLWCGMRDYDGWQSIASQ